MSSSLINSDGRASTGLPLQKQKMHSFAHWRGTICSIEFDLPIISALLAHFEHQLGFACGLKAEIEVIADNPAVDLYYSVACLELQLGTKTLGNNFGDLDAAAPDVCYCWCYCEFVHNGKR